MSATDQEREKYIKSDDSHNIFPSNEFLVTSCHNDYTSVKLTKIYRASVIANLVQNARPMHPPCGTGER